MQDRKNEHIELALSSRAGIRPSWVSSLSYEPLFSSFEFKSLETTFLNKMIKAPFMVSSMTGGASSAYEINSRLAKMCKDFGIPMALGSCRPLLHSSKDIKDFDMRKILGDELPLIANLGIHQVDELLRSNEVKAFKNLLNDLDSDLLMIHINPLQEFTQREGDKFVRSPFHILSDFAMKVDVPFGVKEVGQGMGYKSLEALHSLPLKVIEFSAYGGTNFTNIELKRRSSVGAMESLSFLGHDAIEMVESINRIKNSGVEYVISGGIKDPLYAHYLSLSCNQKHILGLASAFLEKAMVSYEELYEFTHSFIETTKFLRNYVFLKESMK